MPKTIAQFPSALALLEDLADREGLTGRARQRFLVFMARFERPVLGGRGRILVGVAGVAGSVGSALALGWGRGPLPGGLVFWGGSLVLGGMLAWAWRSAQRRGSGPDLELNWRVYCLVLRPVVLAEKPGLLDRNLPGDQGGRERTDLRVGEVYGSLLRDRGVEFWGAGLVGLGMGMLAWFVGERWGWVAGPWAGILPVAGAVMGPLLWGGVQWLAFYVACRRPWLRRW